MVNHRPRQTGQLTRSVTVLAKRIKSRGQSPFQPNGPTHEVSLCISQMGQLAMSVTVPFKQANSRGQSTSQPNGPTHKVSHRPSQTGQLTRPVTVLAKRTNSRGQSPLQSNGPTHVAGHSNVKRANSLGQLDSAVLSRAPPGTYTHPQHTVSLRTGSHQGR